MKPFLLLSFLLFSCGDDAAPVGDTGDLSGTVKDGKGHPVDGATVQVGGVEVLADAAGAFHVKDIPKGPVTVSVKAPWFATSKTSTDVKPDVDNSITFVLNPRPLKIEAEDRTMAETTQKTFDWRTSRTSFSVIEGPTQGRIDRAMYHLNPALYRDDSTEPAVSPAPPLAIKQGVASGFSFPRTDPKEAIVLASIVDTLDATLLPASAKASYLMWVPLLNALLLRQDATEAATALSETAAAIEKQSWGGSGAITQRIGRVFFDQEKKALWVEIIFGSFVALGEGITDSDGDGYPEIFASIAPLKDINTLATAIKDYTETPVDTIGVKTILEDLMNALYSTSNPAITSSLGEAYDVPGVGTLTYPTAVVRHGDGTVNIFLMAP
ncbi:MAG: carboxypeptidase regulatory-like domain-containing protein [Deltaproteobacteria bacterium]|nr:carboxypeptidase regulatory-like domain-containing protein [Deltaproteobacteria bacterium]